MPKRMEWWREFEQRLTGAGFRECRETPERPSTPPGAAAPACLGEGCPGVPEYRDYFRGGEYMGFIVCPACGGVWNPTTHERFH